MRYNERRNGSVAQRESTALTLQGSLVQSQSFPPSKAQGKPWAFVVWWKPLVPVPFLDKEDFATCLARSVDFILIAPTGEALFPTAIA